LKILDSGFRRNDEKRGISTFYETIKVDLVMKEALKPNLGKRILKEVVML